MRNVEEASPALDPVVLGLQHRRDLGQEQLRVGGFRVAPDDGGIVVVVPDQDAGSRGGQESDHGGIGL